MHILTCSQPIDLGAAGTVKPGRYVTEDIPSAEMLVHAERGTATLAPFVEMLHVRRFEAAQDWNGKTILFMRSGGFGDSLFMVPIFREMRRRWPNISISVACRKERFAVFDGLGYVNGWVPTPVSVELAASFDAVVSFEHVIEREKSAHYVDALAAHMGLALPGGPESRRVEYRISATEKLWSFAHYRKKSGVKRLGIQMLSGSRYRSYPRDQMAAVAAALVAKDWEVLIFGVRGDCPQSAPFPGVRNLAEKGLTFRQSASVLPSCDCFVGPDSSLVALCGALDIPTVALYGPIDSKLRTKYAPSITAIDGNGDCAKCNFHEKGGISFPRGKPCEKSGRCEVLAGISPERIIQAIELAVSQENA